MSPSLWSLRISGGDMTHIHWRLLFLDNKWNLHKAAVMRRTRNIFTESHKTDTIVPGDKGKYSILVGTAQTSLSAARAITGLVTRLLYTILCYAPVTSRTAVTILLWHHSLYFNHFQSCSHNSVVTSYLPLSPNQQLNGVFFCTLWIFWSYVCMFFCCLS